MTCTQPAVPAAHRARVGSSARSTSQPIRAARVLISCAFDDPRVGLDHWRGAEIILLAAAVLRDNALAGAGAWREVAERSAGDHTETATSGR